MDETNTYTVMSFFDESKWNFGICWPRFIPCIPILKAKPCEVKCCCSICMYLTRKKYRIIVFKQQTFLASLIIVFFLIQVLSNQTENLQNITWKLPSSQKNFLEIARQACIERNYVAHALFSDGIRA